MPSPLTPPARFDPSPRLRMRRLVRPLLEHLLARASRFQDTPLQFEIDSAGVAVAAWSSFSADLPVADRRLLSDGAQLCAALDLLIEQALEDAEPFSDVDVDDSRDHVLLGDTAKLDIDMARDTALDSPLVRIAEWFDGLCGSLRAVHTRATEVVRLRVEGYGSRDIAARLGTGARLVRRLLTDVRCELEQARRRIPTSC